MVSNQEKAFLVKINVVNIWLICPLKRNQSKLKILSFIIIEFVERTLLFSEPERKKTESAVAIWSSFRSIDK